MYCVKCGTEIKQGQTECVKCGLPIKKEQKESNQTCLILAIVFGVLFFFGIFIIGILTAIAMPQYFKAVQKARAAEALTVIDTIAQSQQRYKIQNAAYTADFKNLDADFITLQGSAAQGSTMQTDNFIITINPPQIQAVSQNQDFQYTLIKNIDTNQTICKGQNDLGISLCRNLGF